MVYYRPHPDDPAVAPDELIDTVRDWLTTRLGHPVVVLDTERADAAAGILLLSLGVTVRPTPRPTLGGPTPGGPTLGGPASGGPTSGGRATPPPPRRPPSGHGGPGPG